MEKTGVGYKPKLHSVEDVGLPCMDVYPALLCIS